MPKVLKSTYRKLWFLSECKKSTSSLASFLRCCKDMANLVFCELWECLTITIKNIASIFRKLSCLSACKKSSSSPIPFLSYCKIAKLLFWVIWPWLASHTLNDRIFLKKSKETFDVDLQAKNQFHPSRSPWYIAKILQNFYFGYFEHAWLPTPIMIL